MPEPVDFSDHYVTKPLLLQLEVAAIAAFLSLFLTRMSKYCLESLDATLRL